MLRFKNSTAFFVLLLIISCSIIKDSDVTSLNQLSQLKLTSIEISQVVNTTAIGPMQSGIASVRDSSFKQVAVPIDVNSFVKNIQNPTNTSLVDSVNKHRIITWPALASSKMMFKSKPSGVITVRTSHYKNGKPRWTRVLQNGLTKEYYSYFYDNKTNWKLTNIFSRIYLSTPAIDTTVYRDSLIYNSDGYVGSIVRKILKPQTQTVTTTLNFTYSSYGDFKNLGGSSVSYNSTQYNYGNGCNCPNGSGNSCFGCSATYTAANGPGGQLVNASASYTITSAQLSTLSVQLQFKDIKNTNGNNCGGGGGNTTSSDTYYFHPLMILDNSFSRGDVLLNIYAIDWWQPGTQVSTNTSTQQNESVTFNFNYAR